LINETHVYFETNAVVRHEMVLTTCSISIDCMRTLSSLLPTLIQVMISHIHDEHTTTAQLARTTLIEISSKLFDKFGLDIVDNIKDSLTKGLLDLPKIARRSNEIATFQAISTVIGYLSFLAALDHHHSSSALQMHRSMYVDSVLNSAIVT